MGIFPDFRGENKKHLEHPPPSYFCLEDIFPTIQIVPSHKSQVEFPESS